MITDKSCSVLYITRMDMKPKNKRDDKFDEVNIHSFPPSVFIQYASHGVVIFTDDNNDRKQKLLKTKY